MSLLAEYFKEMKIKEVIESEHGFVTYYFVDNDIYIEDIYVRPEHRANGLAKQMLDQISEIAKTKGCKKVFGSCVPNAAKSTESLQAAFHYGFRLHSSVNNFIIYSKDV